MTQCGEIQILTVKDKEVGKSYSNNNIEPTVNGLYIVEVTTDLETSVETLLVTSLYARHIISMNEAAISLGYQNAEEMIQDAVENEGVDIQELYEEFGVFTMEELVIAMTDFSTPYYDGRDTVDYSESVNNNGGFYIGRYEAGSDSYSNNRRTAFKPRRVLSI